VRKRSQRHYLDIERTSGINASKERGDYGKMDNERQTRASGRSKTRKIEDGAGKNKTSKIKEAISDGRVIKQRHGRMRKRHQTLSVEKAGVGLACCRCLVTGHNGRQAATAYRVDIETWAINE